MTDEQLKMTEGMTKIQFELKARNMPLWNDLTVEDRRTLAAPYMAGFSAEEAVTHWNEH